MLTHRRRKEIASLSRRKHRERLGQFVIEGVRSVEAAVEAGAPLVDVLVTEEARADHRLAAALDACQAPVHVVAEHELDAVADVQTSQGILAVAEAVWASAAGVQASRRVLALDGVQDPGNVGTLVRTAAWFGVDAVLAGAGTADLFNPKVVRAAMGGLWDVRLARTSALADALSRLRVAGFAVYGADLEGVDARTWRPEAPSVLVMGSEAHGLSSEIIDGLDGRVCIQGAARRRGAESLNVAIAAGILMHAWAGGAR